MGRYTDYMENTVFDYGMAEEINREDVKDFLNKIESFRSFGDGLKYIMKERYPDKEKEIENAPDKFLIQCCETNNVPIKVIGARNTISGKNGWFNKVGGVKEGGPKGGDSNREKIFAIAFGLNLDFDLTQKLFQKVYLDRVFNIRNKNEMVYYYCIKNNRSWNNAKELIKNSNLCSNTKSNQNNTIYTSVMEGDVNAISTDQELLDYISLQQYNLNKKNVKAKELLEELKSNAKYIAKIESQNVEYYPNEEGYGNFEFYGKSHNSIECMFYTIIAQEVSNKKGSKTVFGKNARIRDSIKHNFPEVTVLNKKEPSYEEIRKMIILLFSYCYWFDSTWRCETFEDDSGVPVLASRPEKNEPKIDIDDYLGEINNTLFDAGLPEMYLGNPYDWMFIYCTLRPYPIDAFRNMISDILSDENVSE